MRGLNTEPKEEAIKKEARKLAQFHKLAMKITDVEYQGDGGKVTFYYIADGRVDFRQLIKRLCYYLQNEKSI